MPQDEEGEQPTLRAGARAGQRLVRPARLIAAEEVECQRYGGVRVSHLPGPPGRRKPTRSYLYTSGHAFPPVLATLSAPPPRQSEDDGCELSGRRRRYPAEGPAAGYGTACRTTRCSASQDLKGSHDETRDRDTAASPPGRVVHRAT